MIETYFLPSFPFEDKQNILGNNKLVIKRNGGNVCFYITTSDGKMIRGLENEEFDMLKEALGLKEDESIANNFSIYIE